MIMWLKTVRAPKFYRYWYFRQYVFSKSLWDDDAEFSSIIGSSIVILSHIVFIVFFIGNGILNLNISRFLFDKNNLYEVIFLTLIIMLICYILFYYNGKWKQIILEFENENEKSRKRGLYYLLLYLFISFFCLFPICITFFFTDK